MLFYRCCSKTILAQCLVFWCLFAGYHINILGHFYLPFFLIINIISDNFMRIYPSCVRQVENYTTRVNKIKLCGLIVLSLSLLWPLFCTKFFRALKSGTKMSALTVSIISKLLLALCALFLYVYCPRSCLKDFRPLLCD